MRLLPLLTTLVAPLAVLVACQSDPSGPPPPPPPGSPISVIPTFAALNGGTALQLTAKIRHDDGSYSQPDDVTWSTSNASVASVDRNGRVLALKPGRAQIVAAWHESRGSSLVTVVETVTKKPKDGCLALRGSAGIPSKGECQ